MSCDLTRSDLQKRLEQSRQKQQEAEDEMDNWRQELIKFNQWVSFIVVSQMASRLLMKFAKSS